MNETFKYKRKPDLIALEGLRAFVKNNEKFKYSFILVGFSDRGMPQYQMRITKGDEILYLCAKNISRSGAVLRLLNLYPAVVSIHQEFGQGSELPIYVDEKNAVEAHTL